MRGLAPRGTEGSWRSGSAGSWRSGSATPWFPPAERLFLVLPLEVVPSWFTLSEGGAPAVGSASAIVGVGGALTLACLAWPHPLRRRSASRRTSIMEEYVRRANALLFPCRPLLLLHIVS